MKSTRCDRVVDALFNPEFTLLLTLATLEALGLAICFDLAGAKFGIKS